jgi:hypothetical protein
VPRECDCRLTAPVFLNREPSGRARREIISCDTGSIFVDVVTVECSTIDRSELNAV